MVQIFQCLDPRSDPPNNLFPKSGPKDWIKPWSAVIMGSADPLKFRSESRIRSNIFRKSAEPVDLFTPSIINTNNKIAYKINSGYST